MNILVLNGSPKKKSDTMCLTNAFLKGLNENGEHDVKIINVIEKNIKPCTGCFGCWKICNGKCVQNDDQNEILELYKNAEIIIWSFPLYCYGMPSHLKAVLDRTIPLVKQQMETVDGYTRHLTEVDFSKIHTVVISGCGFPNYEHNFEGLEKQCQYSFGNLTTVFVPETPMLNVPEADVVTKPKLEAFEKAGREYLKAFSLSKETIEELQSLMIPKEDYINCIK